MKYFLIAAVIVAAACTVPPQSPRHDPAPEPVVVMPEIEIRAERETHRKATPKTHVSLPCAGIDTGDMKEDVRAKLDCLTAR